MKDTRSELTAYQHLAANTKATRELIASWERPSICKRPRKLTLMQRIARFLGL